MSSYLWRQATEQPDYEPPDDDDYCPTCGAELVFVQSATCEGEGRMELGHCHACMGDGGKYECPNEPHTPAFMAYLKFENEHAAEIEAWQDQQTELARKAEIAALAAEDEWIAAEESEE
jgi:hypothetical protein